jgi:hypothetical protein
LLKDLCRIVRYIAFFGGAAFKEGANERNNSMKRSNRLIRKARPIPNGFMNVAEIIGKTITDIRFKWESHEGDLDNFESCITLNSKYTIEFPLSGAKQVVIVKFKGIAKRLSKDIQKLLIGSMIINIIEPYHKNEPDFSEKPFLQLSNNMFITETNIAPHGTGAARMYIYDIHEFKNLLIDAKANDFDFKTIAGDIITL